MRESIPVFFCTDNHYAVPTYMALFSLLANCDSETEVRAHLLVSADFSEKNRALFETLTRKYPMLVLRFIHMGTAYASVEIQNSRITTPTMYRLMIPRLVRENGLDIRKCIYLDSDLVVEGNIGELYQIDLGENLAGGVIDYLLADDAQEKRKESLGVPSLERYINAGVLLLNIQEMLAQGTEKKLEALGNRNGFEYNDQDVINAVCYGKVKTIPYRFNINSSCLYDEDDAVYRKYGRDQMAEARRKPVVIHYNAWRKPWSYRYMLLGGAWWKYVRLQEADVLENHINPFLREVKKPFDLPDALKAALKKTGAYAPLRKAYRFVVNFQNN